MSRLITITFMIAILICAGGCNIDLSEQNQKDTAIAEKVNQELQSRQAIFAEYIKEVKMDKSNKGHYKFKFEKDDLTAQDIWDWTVKLLAVVEKAEGVVASGRSSLVVHGSMSGEEVVIGKYVSGATTNPVPFIVELQGSFAGETIQENWKVAR